jgi:hypothetical protein
MGALPHAARARRSRRGGDLRLLQGTLEDLESGQAESDFEERRDAIAPYVEAVIANGVYEIVESLEL